VLNRIHAASLLDVHEHSRVVATVIVTLPPSAVTDCGFAVTDVAQRTSDGPETWLTLVDPHATTPHARRVVTSEVTARANS